MDQSKIPFRISELIARMLTDSLDESGRAELDYWLKDESNNELFQTIIRADKIRENLKKFEKTDIVKARMSLIKKGYQPVKKTLFLQKAMKYAAIILLPFIVISALYFTLDTGNLFLRKELAILPGKSKAILELSDGRVLDLEEAEQSQLIEKDGTKVVTTSHSVVYQSLPESLTDQKEDFNTLTIPRGGEFQLILSDGSKVWLNSESRLKYPVQFDGKNRKVYLEGEAYFEIAHNPACPFIVSVSNVEALVLGTSFNMMAYSNDRRIETTLVEGSVSLNDSNKTNSVTLDPGEQAVYNPDRERFQIQKVNTNIYTAWKDHRFEFLNEPLESIMIKLKRWYNVEIVFKEEELKQLAFSGRMQRYEKINTILELFEMTKKVKFIIEGQKIIVTRYGK